MKGSAAADIRLRRLDFAVVGLLGTARKHQQQVVSPMTVPLTVTGTPRYMSPKLCKEDALDGRSDVYVLRCILLE